MEKEKEWNEIDSKQKLILLANALGISLREFSRSIGKSESYVASLRNDITLNVVNKILITYPQTNLQWLVTGIGDIFCKRPLSEELRDYVIEENKSLKQENKELLIEIGKLQGTIAELEKRNARMEEDVECADARNYKLVK